MLSLYIKVYNVNFLSRNSDVKVIEINIISRSYMIRFLLKLASED